MIRGLGLRRPIVLGHSWGGNVVLELGVREPRLVSGLILLDGGFGTLRDGMDWKTAKQSLAPPPIAGTPVDQFLAMVRGFMPADMEFTPDWRRWLGHSFGSIKAVGSGQGCRGRTT